jgi:replication factor A1
MYSLEEIVNKIKEATGMKEEEIINKIKEKRKELSNLISEEGAAYILAKDLGINLIEKRRHIVKIGNIVPGMRNIDVVGRITDIKEIKTFETEREGEKVIGKLLSFHIGDETGKIRVVLWNNEIEKFKGFSVDDVVLISNANVKDNFGQLEIRIPNGTIELVKSEIAEKIPKKEDIKEQKREYKPITISELKEGENARIRGAIVQIFDSNPFFYTCPECGAKVKIKCDVHNKGEANLVISGIVDDGTGNIRIVLFRENAEKFLGISAKEAIEKNIDVIKKANEMLGIDFIFKGYAKRNKLFDRMEFIVNEIEEVDLEREIEELQKELSHFRF